MSKGERVLILASAGDGERSLVTAEKMLNRYGRPQYRVKSVGIKYFRSEAALLEYAQKEYGLTWEPAGGH